MREILWCGGLLVEGFLEFTVGGLHKVAVS